MLETIRYPEKLKSAGDDEITPELLKHMGPPGIEILINTGKPVLSLFKKGDCRACANY